MERTLALDVGDRRIGIAVSDELGLTAQVAGVYHCRDRRQDIEFISARALELGCDLIVVGLPRNMNGTYGPRAEKTTEFAKALTAHSGVPTRMWDERLTTVEAERFLIAANVRRSDRKKVIDQTAAVLILQGYLDSRRYEAGLNGKG